ncbi:22K protein [reindeer adenovirus 1]|uniref:22K protein n=1 Tax=reindeer adenovirus 1 TaxID=2885353 RepID=A0AAE8Y8A9_9ADEN|nr:22K protein [reindeer adenovirus 1]
MRARTTPGTGASAPATEQAQPPQTAEPPSKKARRKATTALNSSAVLEDISEGEEGFPLTDEDDGETLDSDFSDFTDEDDEEEDMISIRRGLGPSGDLEEGEIPTTTTAAAAAAAAAAPKRGQGKKSRWDQQVRTAAPLKGVRGKKSYSSWKPLKAAILSCLLQSSGSTSFTRRYLLFRHGVSVPSRVIRYYNSHYRREAGQDRQPEPKTEPPQCQLGGGPNSAPTGTSARTRPATPRRRQRRHSRKAPRAHLSHPLRDIPAESGPALPPQSEK